MDKFMIFEYNTELKFRFKLVMKNSHGVALPIEIIG